MLLTKYLFTKKDILELEKMSMDDYMASKVKFFHYCALITHQIASNI